MSVPVRRKRLFFIFAIIASALIVIPFFTVQNNYVAITCDLSEHLPSYTKYKSLHDQDINDILRILQTTPDLWGYRGRYTSGYDTVASRIKSQKNWVQQISETTFIKNVTPKKILVYLEPHFDRYWFTENRLKCPYAPNFEDKCELVLENRSWREILKNHPPQSYYRDLQVDAVIGVRNGYWGDDLWYSEPTLPPGVQQIFYVFESPCHTGSARLGRNRAWLSTYWRGADIPVPYRQFIQTISGKMGVNDSTQLVNDNRKPVAAMISNCAFVQNDRMGYIRTLQKYIPVDIFGKCGDKNNVCPKTGDCLEYLGSRYKFYLAFENCNCEDYVSEKFFVNALQHNMVPVVMGAFPENYATAAPAMSFIHVNDFSTPKELAEYLQILNTNDELYREYGNWRHPDPFFSGNGWELSTESGADFFCRACALLYYSDFKPPPPYPSCFTRWKDLNKCSTKDEWKSSA